jgi:hypothetical protein
VTIVKETNRFHTRLKVSDGHMAALKIMNRSFYDNWHYTIHSCG